MCATKPMYDVLKFRIKKKFSIYFLNPFVFCSPLQKCLHMPMTASKMEYNEHTRYDLVVETNKLCSFFSVIVRC